MNTEVVEVTPQIAKDWLELSGTNRIVSNKIVGIYARDMEHGAWMETGEAIKFSKSGELIDGQHRLHAVIKAETPVKMLVVKGVSPQAQSVMDTGRKRTAADDLSIRGEKNSVLLAATIKLALGMEAVGDTADPYKHEPTHTEIREFLARNESIRTSVNLIKTMAKHTDCPPTIVAYTHWVLSGINRGDADNFWVAIAEKVGLDRGDPCLTLIAKFGEIRRNRQTLPKKVYISMVYRAWNARRKGQEMTFIRIKSPGGGLIPIPKPV